MVPVPVKMPSTAAADALKTGLMPLLEQKQQQLPINTKNQEQKPQFQEVHTSCILDSDEINKNINESQLNLNSQGSNSQNSNTSNSLNSLTSHRTIIPPPAAASTFNEKPEKNCEKVSLNCNCKNSTSNTNQTTSSVPSVHSPLTTHTTGGAEPCEDLDPDKHSLLTRSVAGGIAGLVEHLAIYPLDTLKTNTQTGLRKQIKIHTNLDYVKWYGTRQAWSGVNALIPACTVAHALQFPCIEFTEQYLEKNNPSINSSFAAGVIGILPHDLVMNPANVVKQRMQMANNKAISSTVLAKELYKNQGMKVFYRSLPAQYSVGAIFMGTFYYSYNDILKNSLNKQAEKYGLEKHWFMMWLIRNTVATAIAVAVTQPIDTIVTRVNVGYGENGNTTIRSSIKNLTLRSSFKGIGARMSCSIPASILTWGTYEAIKYTLVEDGKKDKLNR